MTIALTSIGCRTNQEEILSLTSELHSQGFGITNDAHTAAAIIINTCSVTAHTEAKTKRLIQSIARKHPSAKILVTGCLAQQSPEELGTMNAVHWVVGNNWKKDIPDILRTSLDGTYHSSITTKDAPLTTSPPSSAEVLKVGRTRFPLKIQEGCNHACTYCIVPLLRGPSRSIDQTQVLSTFQSALELGYKEIVLTGTHIGQYKTSPTYRLLDLLYDMVAIRGDFRLRLSSLDPRDCTEALLYLLEHERRMCKHIHVSAQSFCPEVLFKMGRKHPSFHQSIELLQSFQTRCPEAGIGGDFIVGFPGETEAMFERTVKVIEQIGFNYGHVFRYSQRPGTKAVELKNQVSENEKIDRSTYVRKRFDSLRKKFIRGQYGYPKHTIIIENEFPAQGITGNFIRVTIPNHKGIKNDWQRVILTQYCPQNNICNGTTQ